MIYLFIYLIALYQGQCHCFYSALVRPKIVSYMAEKKKNKRNNWNLTYILKCMHSIWYLQYMVYTVNGSDDKISPFFPTEDLSILQFGQ